MQWLCMYCGKWWEAKPLVDSGIRCDPNKPFKCPECMANGVPDKIAEEENSFGDNFNGDGTAHGDGSPI
jgi:hypothetical protein